MSNDQLKQSLQDALKNKDLEPATKDIELTDGDMAEVAGGQCTGFCGTFHAMAA